MEEGAKEEKLEERKEQEKEEVKEEQEEKAEEKPEEEKKEEKIEKRKFGFSNFDFKTNKKLWLNVFFIIVLIAIIILSIWIRTQNIPQLKDITTGGYTLGPDLDPFLFLRSAQEISQGEFQDLDMMRRAPLGASNFAKFNLMPWAIFYIYVIFALHSIEYAAIIAPVIFFSLTLLVFFFFVRKLFFSMTDKTKATIVALIATALYAVIPEMLHRTTAGIPELESLGMLWFWCAFLFFVWAWQSNKIKKIAPLAVLSGIFTGLMIWTWGGYKYIFMIFALTSFLLFFFNKEKRKNFLIYCLWIIPALLFALIQGQGFQTIITSISDTGFASIVFFILLVDTVIFNTKLKKVKEKINLPKNIISLIISVIIIILFLLIFNPGFILQGASRIVEGLLYPFGHGRIALTVAENRAPYFVEVFGSFGLLFWIFFFGSIFLFYEATKHFDKKKKIWFNVFFILFILSFIFSRISPQSLLNGDNFISRLLYFGGLLLFALVLVYTYIKAYLKKDDKTLEDFSNINLSYVLILVFIFWTIISMRGAIRLFFIISPVLIIAASFLPVKFSEYSFKEKDNLYKIILWCVVIIVIVSLVVVFINSFRSTTYSAKYSIPGPYYQQWQRAMQWVREETPENSIFVHWWDYGYWIQTTGERPTVTDGGHASGFWDHTTARYLMTAQNEKTALQLCKAHNVSYFLIDSTEIGKYVAYSSIGSDETGNDKLSWITSFVLDEKQTQETREEILYVYTGGTMVDEDIEWEGQLFPRSKAIIAGFILSVDKEKGTVNNVKAAVYNNEKRYMVPLKYVYINNALIELETGTEEVMNSALYIIPRFVDQGINNIGASLYLSERALNAHWVRLYLLDQTENFELVHKQDSLFIEQLKQADATTKDIIYFNGIQGPIKIWKVNYPEDIQFYEEYLRAPEGWTQDTGPWASLDYLGT